MSDRHPELADGLDVHQVDDGMVVYDLNTDRVHYLNPTASVVLGLCDGTRSEADLAGLVQDAWSLDAPPTAEVQACIEQLRGEGVLR
ncbi:PqqD family protein [Actinospongicola halichondriae]|uniref:PqqD family protein n=1 Tax=Actinospongicola halichondriae TaxID=3236844 RepID=UPI003D4225CB